VVWQRPRSAISCVGSRATWRPRSSPNGLKHDDTFCVDIAGEVATHTYRLGIEPEAYFAGKTIRVSGQILLYRNHLHGKITHHIRVENIDRLEIVKKHKGETDTLLGR
jgi:hypothetical protein